MKATLSKSGAAIYFYDIEPNFVGMRDTPRIRRELERLRVFLSTETLSFYSNALTYTQKVAYEKVRKEIVDIIERVKEKLSSYTRTSRKSTSIGDKRTEITKNSSIRRRSIRSLKDVLEVAGGVKWIHPVDKSTRL